MELKYYFLSPRIFCLAFLMLLSLMAYAASAQIQEETPHTINLYMGASYNYIYNGDNYAIVVYDEYERRVEFWLIKNGDLIDRAICYKGDICYLKNIKLKLTIVFCGREARAVWFDILKIYEIPKG